MNMTNLQVRLIAVPLVMIAAAVIGNAQFRGIDGEIPFVLSAIPFVGGCILFVLDIIKSIKQNP